MDKQMEVQQLETQQERFCQECRFMAGAGSIEFSTSGDLDVGKGAQWR